MRRRVFTPTQRMASCFPPLHPGNSKFFGQMLFRIVEQSSDELSIQQFSVPLILIIQYIYSNPANMACDQAYLMQKSEESQSSNCCDISGKISIDTTCDISVGITSLKPEFSLDLLICFGSML